MAGRHLRTQVASSSGGNKLFSPSQRAELSQKPQPENKKQQTYRPTSRNCARNAASVATGPPAL